MIAKIVKGKGFRGALNYLLGERGQIIGGNMAGRTARELAAEFKTVRQLRPKVGKAVVHIPLSAHPSDRTLTDAEMAAIAERLATALGYEHSPRVVIRHHDTEHQHIHLLLSKIDSNGQAVSDAHDYRKADQVMRQIELDYGLTRVASPSPKAKPPRATQTKNIKEAIMQTTNEHDQDTDAHASDHELAQHRPVMPEMGMKDATDYGSKHKNINARRNSKRHLVSPEYEQWARQLFGDELVGIKQGVKGSELSFGPPKAISDQGQTIMAHAMPDQEAAHKMVAMAKAKGWKQVTFSGTDSFVREAMRQAMMSGLTVAPANLHQAGMLDEVKAQISGQAMVALLDGKPVGTDLLDKLRQRRQQNGSLDKGYQPRKPWFKP